MMIKNLKSNHLTNATLFKRPGGKSWTLLKNTNQIVVHEENQATNWDKYIKACQIVGGYGVNYSVQTYKRGKGIKGAKVAAPGVALVKVKNKPNHLKAVQYLGKYSQHKPLLKEVIKTLDFLEK